MNKNNGSPLIYLALVALFIAVGFTLLSRSTQQTSPVSRSLNSPLIVPTGPSSNPVSLTPTPPSLPATVSPTPTGLPIVGPASDASGTLLFAARESSTAGVYALHTSPAGAPTDQATRLSTTTKFQWGTFHAAPNGTRLAVIGDWNVTQILDTAANTLSALFRDKMDSEVLFFSWHPDSHHLLVRAETNYPDAGLWLVDTDTGDHTTLATDRNPSSFRDGAVSPDGRHVIYSTSHGVNDIGRIWVVGADGGTPTLIYTATMADFFGFTWSPDGSKIAFVGDGLQVMNADGSDVHVLSKNFAGGLMFEPIWSPDSRTLAFVAQDGPSAWSDKLATPVGKDKFEQWDNASFKGTNIHLVDVYSGIERRLLPDTGNIDPTWSPDGKQIAFASTRSGQHEIWIVNADGSSLRQVTHAEQLVRYPYWHK